MTDDVEALKRELEALKLQLEQERKKNAAAADNPQQKPAQREQSTESKQRGADAKNATDSKEQRVYVQHAAVGSRRGKWWLRDRQVLSRAASEDGGGATLKVRETWVWSGRTVVVDKIVRLDDEEEEEEEGQEPVELEQAQPEAKQPHDADITSVVPVEVAAAPSETSPQQSDATEKSEAVSTREEDAAPAEMIDQAVAASPPTPVKAEDEVRESSAPAAELPAMVAVNNSDSV
ncbi:hypothetical protein PF005_g1266 [Phytophthora fragariae]|uniref:Uncharacterized protein n=1 Tax=Phytophthora fragariae TaxID=53985 RepID=A0A6A3TSH6_9STRA|nr:hypothetical protein PF003_g20623 [Phytophthora fragariae]KAE8950184.1 hypothetical protein PF009_g291 [Phytophthora fragariae]KAE9031376.1 hypothetical protein PF011_g152 [Phytophthora fragariae]KAE9140665.1 hypothetical protein PF010_g91 [Phytophthora fragariae]KAE9141137.1 hypothetical protein PF007_g331 [Phytophthora fragariae]